MKEHRILATRSDCSSGGRGMNQPIEKGMRGSNERKRKHLSLSPVVVTTMHTSDPTNAKSSQVLIPAWNDCTTRNVYEDEFNDDERIVATSLKKQRRCDERSYLTPSLREKSHNRAVPVPSMFRATIPPPTQRKQVRFASYATMKIVQPHEENTWYERKDYDSFELDCRQSIVACLTLRSKEAAAAAAAEGATPSVVAMTTDTSRSSVRQPPMTDSRSIMISAATVQGNDMIQQPPPSSQGERQQQQSPPSVPPHEIIESDGTVANVSCKPKWFFTIHGLDDFVSIEAKVQRTRRRLIHCYNVLYHQWLLRQFPTESGDGSPVPPVVDAGGHGNRAISTRGTTTTTIAAATTIPYTAAEKAICLRQMAVLSSVESIRLALDRGQSLSVATNNTTTVN